jgi:hypothetical protein
VDDCIEWAGHIDRDGYGRTSRNGKTIGAHRLVYEEEVGPVPVGLEIDHLCRNRRCTNVTHLEPVTHRENCRRGLVGKRFSIRTHCSKGHEYTKENVLITIGKRPGRRECRACHFIWMAKFRAKKKEGL